MISKAQKRAIRSKSKAKQAKIAKQNQKKLIAVVAISPEIIRFFRELSPPSLDYEFVPQIKVFVEQADQGLSDIESGVGLLSAMYVIWFDTQKEEIDKIALEALAEVVLAKKEFQQQYDSK